MLSNLREQQIDELKNFSDLINEELTSVVTTLGWTKESLTEETEFFECPYDPAHRVPVQSFDKHLNACQWKAEGYGESDMPLSEPTLPATACSSIRFDEELQNKILRKAKEENPSLNIEIYEYYTWHGLDYIFIRENILVCYVLYLLLERHEFLTLIIGLGEQLIPRTSDRLLTDFTSDTRKIIYDYVIANTTRLEIGQDIEDISKLQTQNKNEKEVSVLELLIQERNLKRRRAKHKGVHTNKKSHTEVLREVINQQMEILTDYMTMQCISESDKGEIHNSRSDDINTEEEQWKNNRTLESSERSSSQYYKNSSKERSEYYPNNKHKHRHDKLNDKIDRHKHRSSIEYNDRYDRLEEDRNYAESKHQKRHDKYSEDSRDRKRSRYNDRSRSRSRSEDRKSHSKSKHRSKEEKHKKKKHKSHDYDPPERCNDRRKHKKKSKDKHKER